MKKKTDKDLTPAFKAMSDVTRLKILLMLESKPRTVGEIVTFFNLSQPTITRHLQALTSAGLVTRKRIGQHVCYELNTENLRSTCVTLVACFPCCGITLKPGESIEACKIEVKKDNKKSPEKDQLSGIVIKVKTKGGKK
jgi:DNA-binding transcriptional ArsR family regulator